MNPSPVVLPDDLIAELLSFLSVKYLLQFKCVSKSWKTLISDSAFVKLHLKRSATQNPMFILVTHHTKTIRKRPPYASHDTFEHDYSVVPYPICSLLNTTSFTVMEDPYYYVKNKGCSNVVGSCNGLILLAGHSFTRPDRESWFRLWNPATKTISKKFGYFCDFTNQPFGFVFGFDDSTSTYKVVASRYISDQLETEVKILSFGDDVWRNIESFPVAPLHLDYHEYNPSYGEYSRVYLSGALNWLAIHDNIDHNSHFIKNIAVVCFVIVSLDLRTEMYKQYVVPYGFDEVPPTEPTIGVLGGCLCFSYSFKETDFVIWQMKKFGVEDSWTQFVKISYYNLQIDYDYSDETTKYKFQLIPLLLLEDDDTIMLRSTQEPQAILYNWRDNRVKRIKVNVSRKRYYLLSDSVQDYVESLVPIY
ncbi:F-box/kelch-repeat protein At3g23880-like [Vicia villosa]|uniref:F-box/kelch-repeat protein At3g23880-like n=1 Tax=Vicia villosa TaxID=3911 RepID=UPI00273B3871|nr:F-box/kelch-repeat protein At3g23880-like [Vicia villosa]